MRLLIATHNPGKKREFGTLFAGLDLELYRLDDLGITEAVPETGDSYLENAATKAQGYARLANMLTLADDSGLEVDALDGRPGVYSARYGGEISDPERCQLLLDALKNVPPEKRSARFRCVVVLAWPNGTQEAVEGVCEGHIASEPRGSNGFGYDPIFLVDAYGKTMAELPSEVKNQISHRARAAAKARAILAALEPGS